MSRASEQDPAIERLGGWRSPVGGSGPAAMRIARYRILGLPAEWDLRGTSWSSPASLAERIEIRPELWDPLRASESPDEALRERRWTLLFADRDALAPPDDGLRGCGGSGTRTQAETILAHHPAFCAAIAARAAAKEPLLVTMGGLATPCLAVGVPLSMPGHDGPERRSHLVAAAAPPPGVGPYWEEEIRAALLTAVGAWGATVAESDGVPVEIHGGWWGCGRLGGNPELMITIQVLATALTGVERLVLSVRDAAGAQRAGIARRAACELICLLRERRDGAVRANDLIDHLLARRFCWGIPSAGWRRRCG